SPPALRPVAPWFISEILSSSVLKLASQLKKSVMLLCGNRPLAHSWNNSVMVFSVTSILFQCNSAKMRMNRIPLRWPVLLTFFCAGQAARAADSINLPPPQREKLIALIKSDKEAEARFNGLKSNALKALEEKPNPIKKIQSEGKLQTDPLK